MKADGPPPSGMKPSGYSYVQVLHHISSRTRTRASEMTSPRVLTSVIMKNGGNFLATAFVLILVYGLLFLRTGPDASYAAGIFVVSLILIICSFFLYTITLELHRMNRIR